MNDRNGTATTTAPVDRPLDASVSVVSTPSGKIAVTIADTVTVPAGEIEVIRDDKGRIARLKRTGLAGSIAVARPSVREVNEQRPLERPVLPTPLPQPALRVRTVLDPHLLWAPPPEAQRVYEACVARVAACGIELPAYEVHWASAFPLNPPHADGYPRGLTQLHAGRLRLIVNVRSDRLERTVFHELAHLSDLPRYAAMCSPEELEGDEVRRELDRRADEFVTWILATPPPPPPAEYAFHVRCGPSASHRYPCS